MTHEEFNQKFSQICKETIHEYQNKDYLKSMLKTSDDSTTVSQEQIALSVFGILLEIQTKLLKSTLEQILEFSD